MPNRAALNQVAANRELRVTLRLTGRQPTSNFAPHYNPQALRRRVTLLRLVSDMSSRPLIWFLCAGALALVLGPYVHRNESSASTTDARPAKRSASSANRAAGSTSEGRTLATSANVSVNDGVSLTLHVTNVTDHSVELTFPSGQAYDFVILDSAGRELWRWSEGHMFTQALKNKFLSSKETLTYQEQWDGVGRSGRFTAVALLKSSNYPVEQRVEFSLP